MILAPLVRGRKGQHKDVFEEIRKAGLLRARVDGAVIDVHEPPDISPQKSHHIEAVIDRVVIREGVRPRLAESIALAISHGDGSLLATYEVRSPGGPVWRDRLFSTQFACPNCKISFEELEPRTFSFNSPYGACPECEGLGALVGFDPELIVPNWSLSLSGGAIAPWKNVSRPALQKLLLRMKPFLERTGIRANSPLDKLLPKDRELLFHGNGKNFPGLLALLEKEYVTTTSDPRQRQLETFRGEVVCAACGGARLRPEALAVKIAGKSIHEVAAMTVSAAREFFRRVDFDEERRPISGPLAGEIATRLEFLDKVGLEYLSLDRPAGTLSGGELQRVRLASGLGSGLVGACYVLDEPSVGLHPRDNGRLIEALGDLQDRGNSVLVVEHDEAIMRQADWLIDIGPGAGSHGGRIVAQGTPDDVAANADSLTGRYLTGAKKFPSRPNAAASLKPDR